ncbi:MAG: hypothetical protein K8R88_07505 [Armatimonadetes bacterium]|nr:hypothetical protein [Armatimonadota bacterium]
MAQNRLQEAFKEPANLLSLASLGAISLATLNPLPILAGLVAEAAFLLFVPDTRWFMDRLDRRYDAEVTARRVRLRDQVWPDISSTRKVQFSRLEAVRGQVEEKKYETQKWYREMLRKLDYLLEKFLLFAAKEDSFAQYMQSVYEETHPIQAVPPRLSRNGEVIESKRTPKLNTDGEIKEMVGKIQKYYEGEIEEMRAELPGEENLHNQAILEKRVEVLERRQQNITRIGDTISNIRHQLSLIEDTFGLISDEVRTLSPEQVLADIDQVVSRADDFMESLREISPMDTMSQEPGAEKLFNS